MPSMTLEIRNIEDYEAVPTERDPRWAKVVSKDASADGTFWYSVATTGVYCRPSCPARLAKPANVKFHHSIEHARAAGFRACLRCRPDDEHNTAHRRAQIVARACQTIEEAAIAPALAELAAEAGLSESYFHRLFKAQTGVTPKAYCTARRASRLRRSLPDSESVTGAIFEAGFNSNSRVYENTAGILGMRPREFQLGGRGTVVYFAVGQCSLGAILVASTDKGVCSVSLGEEPEKLVAELQTLFPEAELVGGDKNYERLVAQVVGLIEDPNLGHSLPLDIRGTAFQQRVWEALRQIPPGRTVTYTEVACSVGQPSAARAVARACAANKLAVAIPCHRVVRNDGSLSGYRWGVQRKRTLLQRENSEPAQ
jgi:AraC family transcriptional regulator of adaptative response/methylated-DNA-[protein]-cysteine methyltransferase